MPTGAQAPISIVLNAYLRLSFSPVFTFNGFKDRKKKRNQQIFAPFFAVVSLIYANFASETRHNGHTTPFIRQTKKRHKHETITHLHDLLVGIPRHPCHPRSPTAGAHRQGSLQENQDRTCEARQGLLRDRPSLGLLAHHREGQHLGEHRHGHQLVSEILRRHPPDLEQHDSKIACHNAPGREEGTARDRPETALRLQLLHFFLLHGLLGLEPMAEGDRLDGPARREHAPGCRWRGMRMEEHAPETGLYRRGDWQVYRRSRLHGLVGDEQPGGMGRSAAPLLVQAAGDAPEEDTRRHAGMGHAPRTAGLLRHDAPRRQGEVGTQRERRRTLERIPTPGQPVAHRPALFRDSRPLL